MAGIGLLAGAQLTMEAAAGQVLALATVTGILAAGARLRRVELIVVGAVGVVQVVPQSSARYLSSGVAAPLALLVVGLVLLAVAVWLAKGRGKPQSP